MAEFKRGFAFDLHHTILNPDLELRSGVKELFERLRSEGTANILTTTGGGPHLKQVFENTGIGRYFEYVFEGAKINTGNGKLYGPVAEILGISPADASHKMIVTGDIEEFDRPADLDQLVFVHHLQGYKYDASLLYTIYDHLLSLGRGSFIEGFYEVERNQNTPIRMFSTQEVGVGTMIDKALVTLSFRDSAKRGITSSQQVGQRILIPTLRIIKANSYLRENVVPEGASGLVLSPQPYQIRQG